MSKCLECVGLQNKKKRFRPTPLCRKHRRRYNKIILATTGISVVIAVALAGVFNL